MSPRMPSAACDDLTAATCHDTVRATVWEMNDAEALVLDRLRMSEGETALEQGWLLAELESRFGYGLEDLARRFDRGVSWVSRRLGLVELLPDSIQFKNECGGETSAPRSR